MAGSMRQSIEALQQTALSTQMRQMLHVLQLSLPELRAYILEAYESNPMLSIDDVAGGGPGPAAQDNAASRSRSAARPDDASGPRDVATRPETFSDYLESQLPYLRLAPNVNRIARHILRCLNERGYLDVSAEALARETSSAPEAVQAALAAVRSLSPAGVGARDLKECLLLQLDRHDPLFSKEAALIADGLPLLAKNRIAEIARLLGLSKAEAARCCDAVRALNPIPSAGFASAAQNAYVLPDVYISWNGVDLHLALRDGYLPTITLNAEYCDLLERPADSDLYHYLKTQRDAAQAVILMVENRQRMLLKLCRAVTARQRRFFSTGRGLVPMTMQELASELDVSVSTISRIVREKYLCCDFGTFSLKSLFTASLACADGQSVSSDEIKRRISALVGGESSAHPYSDAQLKDALSQSGLQISLRTVTKYRTALGIDSSFRRKRCD